jgi:hypothetical protein
MKLFMNKSYGGHLKLNINLNWENHQHSPNDLMFVW